MMATVWTGGLNWGSQCREPAASKWCQSKGYDKALDWIIKKNIDLSAPTKVFVVEKYVVSSIVTGSEKLFAGLKAGK